MNYGSTYVGIQYTDNSMILFGNILEQKDADPLIFHGFEENPVNVAKSMVIYQMLK